MSLPLLPRVPPYLYPSQYPACPTVYIRAECHLRRHQTWPGVKHTVLPHPQGMAWLPQTGPKDLLTHLGCLGQAVPRGQYSPDGRLSLCSPRTPWLHPCWSSQNTPGDGEDANTRDGCSLLAQHQHQHHWLCTQVHHMHKAQGLPTGLANGSLRHSQWPKAGDQSQSLPPKKVKSTCSSAICLANIPSNLKSLPNPATPYPKSYKNSSLSMDHSASITQTTALPSHLRNFPSSCSDSTSTTSPLPQIFPDPMLS